MASNMYDIIVIADVRFPGSTGSAIAAEIAAQAAHGYRTGLLPVRSPALRFPHRTHADIRRLVRREACEIVSAAHPVECGLVIVHAPEAFLEPFSRPLRIHSGQRWCIVRDSRWAGDGSGSDWVRIDRHLQQALGGQMAWQVGSIDLAAQLQPSELAGRLEQELWAPTVEPARWQRDVDQRPRNGTVIGTSGGNDPRLWPTSREAVLCFLPPGPDQVRVAAPLRLFERLAAPFPPAWQVSAFHPDQRAAFLRDLDIFVRLGRPDVVDDAIVPILEAMASGCALVLPSHWRAQLEHGPLFVEPESAADAVRLLASDREECTRRAAACVQLVHERFAPEKHVERLRARLGRPAPRAVAVPRTFERHVLFVASNGIGIGHITRCLAIAKRCPRSVVPVFVTFSQAAPLISDFGFPVHYIAGHQYLGVDQEAWNVHLECELRELVHLYDPPVVLFDGNHPYLGLVKALAASRTVWKIWCRRAMWRPGRGKSALEREGHFDLVLEPGELAATADQGLTRDRRARTHRVAPIRLVDDGAALTRELARDALGLPHNRVCVLVTLGGGNNFDFSEVRNLSFTALQARQEVSIAYAASPITSAAVDLPGDVLPLSVYPLARYLAAFDGAISAAGYNSFHELLAARLATVFIPNENMQMDDQTARADFAARCGLALCARPGNPYALTRCLRELLDPSIRASLRRRMAEWPAENGAETAAEIVAELACSVRTEGSAGSISH